MNLQAVKQIGTKGLGRLALRAKKYAPEILTATGVVGVVTAAVMGARATLKLEDTLDYIEQGKNIIDSREKDESYSPQERRQDLVYIYSKGTVEIIKLYGPAVTLGVASLAAILSSHGIMRRRNAGLVAAYKVIETGFKEYRDRVAEEIGVDEERDLYKNVVRKKVEDSEGKERVLVERRDDNLSPYAREFDTTCPNWNHKSEYNLVFLRAQEQYANDLLTARGHLFLNEVYDAIGIPRCPEGQVVGWVKDGPDGYVSFGLFDRGSDEELDYFYYNRQSILLDFNVDGVVYDKI